MVEPTRAEVETEIAALRAVKPRVRHYTYFDDDNWAAIEAQVQVLDEDMAEEEIFEEWPEDDGLDKALRDAALEARAWLDGEYEGDEDTLSAEWEHLAK